MGFPAMTGAWSIREKLVGGRVGGKRARVHRLDVESTSWASKGSSLSSIYILLVWAIESSGASIYAGHCVLDRFTGLVRVSGGNGNRAGPARQTCAFDGDNEAVGAWAKVTCDAKPSAEAGQWLAAGKAFPPS